LFSTIEHHIAPWHSTCAGAKLLAGIINPPAANKHGTER